MFKIVIWPLDLKVFQGMMVVSPDESLWMSVVFNELACIESHSTEIREGRPGESLL